MTDFQEFSEGGMRIRLREEEGEIRLEFLGNTNGLEASRFLRPIWKKILEMGADGRRLIVLDCSRLEFINSSTLARFIELLKEGRAGVQRIWILYNEDVKWQRLSFNMLDAFETADQRIRIAAAT